MAGEKPAARLTDMHICPLFDGLVPHVGGPIAYGLPTVLIGGLAAARVTDMAVCIGPPDAIARGSPTVFIGGLPAARMGDQTMHGGVIVMGHPTVLIGDSANGSSGASDDVSGMSLEDKMLAAIKYADLPDAVLKQLGDLKVLAASFAFVSVALAALALTGFGAVAEVIAGGLLLAGAALSGVQIGKGLAALADFVSLSRDARTTDDLKRAGARFADGVAAVGVGGVGAVLSVAGARGLPAGTSGGRIGADMAEAGEAVPGRLDLPKNPDDLLKSGWTETTHPKAAENGRRTFEDPQTGENIEFDKGRAGEPGFRGLDHYHRTNPDRTNKRDAYLDVDGNPVPDGSKRSHILPGSN